MRDRRECPRCASWDTKKQWQEFRGREILTIRTCECGMQWENYFRLERTEP